MISCTSFSEYLTLDFFLLLTEPSLSTILIWVISAILPFLNNEFVCASNNDICPFIWAPNVPITNIRINAIASDSVATLNLFLALFMFFLARSNSIPNNFLEILDVFTFLVLTT